MGFQLQNFFQLQKRSVRLDEDYRVDPRTGVWTVTLAGGAYVASAGAWSGEFWTFDGTTRTSDNKHFAVRMIYRYLDSRAFRRDFEVRRGNGWITYAAETCTRGP